MAAKQCHVMMFPWLAFGHLLPFLELTKKLAASGIKVSFLSTPSNLQIVPPIPTTLADEIKLVEIPLPSVNGFPETCEATIDLQQEQIKYLKKAYDKLLAPFEKLQKNLPDLILIDFSSYWIPQTVAKFGMASAFFSIYTTAALAFIGRPNDIKSGNQCKSPDEFVTSPAWITFPFLVAHRPNYAPTMIRILHFQDASGKSSGQRLGTVVEESDFVAIRSCKEFEGKYIDLLEKLYQRPVLHICVLPPVVAKNRTCNAIDSN